MAFLDQIIHSIVPHKKHGNIPHLLKAECIGLLSLLVVVLFFLNQNNFYIIDKLGLTGAIYPAVLIDLTNQDRTENGVHTLAWNDTLESAAKLKAYDMVQNKYFAHTSPTGISPWYWFSQAKYDFVYAGENLAVDFTESSDVEKAWLNSPTHRANVLNSHYTEIGIAATNGTIDGRDTIFVVEFFGKPLGKVAGISTTNSPAPKTKTTAPLKIIKEIDKSNEKFISAKNLEATEEVLGSAATNQGSMSNWYMRLAVQPTNTIKIVYGTIFGLILVAMILVFSKEYQRHHTKHLFFGLLLITLTGTFFFLMNSPSILLAFN